MKTNTALRSALNQKAAPLPSDKIREVYAEVSRRAQYHAQGLITADELINHCVRADTQLYLLLNRL